MVRHGDVTIDTRSLVDKVYDYLLGQIIDGEIKYGDNLKIQELAEQLCVSAMPVREALKRLQYEITESMRGLENEQDAHIRERKSIELDRQFHAEICKLTENNYINNL